ncbi:MAG: heme ABC exporter ATP-binding protein CcmA [Anaerolineae bacterium]
MSVLLRLQELSCQRDGRVLFDGLNLTVCGGECLELRGPNGSGKSTLLRAILGLFPDVTGTIQASGCLYLGHRLGLNGLLTAEENLRWYQALQHGRGVVSDALQRVGMAGYERVPCQHMSAGQQRRVALARLLLGASPLWLLDEPFTALDLEGQALVRALIGEQMERDGAVVCATHQPLALAGARVLDLGQSVQAGSPAGRPAPAGFGQS